MNTLSDLRPLFARNELPIFYINTTPFNLLGADEWIGGLRFINTVDSFEGEHPSVFVPSDARARCFPNLTAANNWLLAQPEVRTKVGAGGKALFLMLDEQTEALAQSLGLAICLPPVALRNRLDSKLVTTELADRAGVRSVPNVLARVASYDDLRRAGRALGDDLVVQLPYGDSGSTTFFIASEADYHPCAERIAAERMVKVMRRIRCRQLTIEACVVRQGVLVGPLQTELVGFAELTPWSGGWCGNEVFAADASALLSPALRREAMQIASRMGEQLRDCGYRGCFGLDLLLDQDTGELYLGEMNPRITGASPMTTQAMLDAGGVPLVLFHLLQWLDMDYRIDVEAFNRRWLEAAPLPTFAQMIIEHCGDVDAVLTCAPRTGLWRMADDGTIEFVRSASSPRALTSESEALFLRTTDIGSSPPKGAGLGRVVLRGRLMTDDYRLTERAARWLRGFRARWQMASAPRRALTEA